MAFTATGTHPVPLVMGAEEARRRHVTAHKKQEVTAHKEEQNGKHKHYTSTIASSLPRVSFRGAGGHLTPLATIPPPLGNVVNIFHVQSYVAPPKSPTFNFCPPVEGFYMKARHVHVKRCEEGKGEKTWRAW